MQLVQHKLVKMLQSQCAKTYILLQLVLTVTVPILFEHVHISLLSHNKKPTMSHFIHSEDNSLLSFRPASTYTLAMHKRSPNSSLPESAFQHQHTHAQVTYSTKFCKDQLLPSSKLHPSPSVPCMSFPQFESSLRYTRRSSNHGSAIWLACWLRPDFGWAGLKAGLNDQTQGKARQGKDTHRLGERPIRALPTS